MLVANGHHWDPRWPEPPFPGSESSRASRSTSTTTASPTSCAGKRVLVLGIGNSAVDIAVESSRIADETFLAMRRGAYVIPKFLGRQADRRSRAAGALTRLPLSVQRFFMARLLKMAVGEMTDYGLPKPDHKLLEAHPTVSSELLPRLGHGDIAVKPNIDRFAGGRTVRFVDGTEEEIDLVVYCTGYQITFPFLDDDVVFGRSDNRMPLYRRVVAVDHPGLYFIGFIQPLGPIMPIAEAQSEWVADLLEGRAALPSAEEMRAEIARDERGDEEALRRLQASHDRGGLPPLPARDPPRAQAGYSAGLTGGGRRGAPPGLLGFRRSRFGRSQSGRAKQDAGTEGHPASSRRRRRGPAVRTAGPGWPGRQRLKPPPESSAASSGLGGLARPPDQPEGAEHRDLEHDQQKEDRQESVHGLSLERSPRQRSPRLAQATAPRCGPPRGRGAARWGPAGSARSRSRAHS